jgi:hypothetical protein
VYEIVKDYLAQMGIDTSTLKIATFGQTTYHDIVLNARVVGSYEHRSKEIKLNYLEE